MGYDIQNDPRDMVYKKTLEMTCESVDQEGVLLRGEMRRKADQIKKLQESHGELHSTSHDRTAAHQDELEVINEGGGGGGGRKGKKKRGGAKIEETGE